MPFTIVVLLALAALILALVHAAGKAPLWPAVLVLAVALLVQGVGIR